VTYDDHVKPVFREHCLSCHNQEQKKGGLALDSYGATMNGGSSGEVVLAGDTESSRLFALVTHAENAQDAANAGQARPDEARCPLQVDRWAAPWKTTAPKP